MCSGTTLGPLSSTWDQCKPGGGVLIEINGVHFCRVSSCRNCLVSLPLKTGGLTWQFIVIDCGSVTYTFQTVLPSFTFHYMLTVTSSVSLKWSQSTFSLHQTVRWPSDADWISSICSLWEFKGPTLWLATGAILEVSNHIWMTTHNSKKCVFPKILRMMTAALQDGAFSFPYVKTFSYATGKFIITCFIYK